MSTYPVVSNPKTCRHCRERVAAAYFCLTHPRTCTTCCSSRLKRGCGLGPWEVPPSRASGRSEAEIAASQAELAHIRNQLFGYLEET